jgi:hypothetical protein
MNTEKSTATPAAQARRLAVECGHPLRGLPAPGQWVPAYLCSVQGALVLKTSNSEHVKPTTHDLQEKKVKSG